MNSRTLGKTGISVSEIGLGCWQFGGDFGPTDDAVSTATMQAAVDAGVTFFDTADVYGGGRSEQVIGRFLPSAPGILHVATKLGRNGDIFASGFTYDDVKPHLMRNLANLGVSSIDLVQLHCIPTEVLREGAVFDVMDRLKTEGLCRNWGASVETIEEAHLCIAHPGCATLQIIFNLFRQDAAWELFDAAQAANVGIIVRLPLASGILSGKFGPDHTFAETDHRNYNADGAAFSVGETFSGIEMSKAIAALDHIRAFVPGGWSMADFALRWILDHPAVSTVIAGASRAEQVVANARASQLPPLSPDTHDALRDVYEVNIRPLVRCAI